MQHVGRITVFELYNGVKVLTSHENEGLTTEILAQSAETYGYKYDPSSSPSIIRMESHERLKQLYFWLRDSGYFNKYEVG